MPGEHRLYENYRAVELREGRSRLSTAKKLLKVAAAMVRDGRVYLPRNGLDLDASGAMSPGQLVAYLKIVAEMLAAKWKSYDLSGIPDESNRLKKWLDSTRDLAAFYEREKKGDSIPS